MEDLETATEEENRTGKRLIEPEIMDAREMNPNHYRPKHVCELRERVRDWQEYCAAHPIII